jgi:hypothetical protein
VSNKLPFGENTERWSPTLALVGGAFILVAALAWLFGGSPEGGNRFLPLVQAGLALGAILLLAAVAIRPSLWMGWFGVRQVRYGLNTLVMAIAFLAIVGLINYVANQQAVVSSLLGNYEWDLTEEQVLTLTQPTKDFIVSLKAPVQIIGFYTSDQRSTQDSVETLLKRYQEVDKTKISYMFVDPQSANSLDMLGKFGIQSVNDLGLYVVQGDRHQKVDGTDEQSITTAIYRLVTTRHTVYFLTGHGEFTPDNGARNAAQALESLGFIVRTTQITSTLVPTDTSALIIAGPLADFRQNEVDTINNYVKGGGAVFLMVDPDLIIESLQTAQSVPASPFGGPLDAYLHATWGITLSHDIVLDFVGSYQQIGPVSTIVSQYPPHQITDKITLPSILVYNRSVLTASPPPASISVSPFLATGQPNNPGDIYGETDTASLKDPSKQPAYDPATDIAGPLNLAVAATIPVSGTQRFGRIVVVGSTSLIADQIPPNITGPITAQTVADRGVWINAVNWLLTDQQGDQNVPPPDTGRSTTTRVLDPTKATPESATWVFLTSVCMIPGLVLLAGVVVFFQRRRMRR